MKPFDHPKDPPEFALRRRVGKKQRGPARYKVAAVAKLAPHELDDLPEDPIRRQIEADIEATGLPYLTFEDADLGWLKRLAPTDYHAARLLSAIKDLPDFIVWRPAPGKPFSLSLPLELKRVGRGGRPGQRNFAAGAGGFITQGYSQAKGAFERFLTAPIPTKGDPHA